MRVVIVPFARKENVRKSQSGLTKLQMEASAKKGYSHD